jgi:hypothetical protein
MTRKDLRTFKVNLAIAGRDYQLEAIQRVAENLVVTGKDGKLRGARREKSAGDGHGQWKNPYFRRDCGYAHQM